MQRFILFLLFLVCTSSFALSDDVANRVLLPNPYKVYYNGKVVINHPDQGFDEKNIPTNNDYSQAPGCYIACYSHTETNSIYPVATDIFMMGQIRVPGTYVNAICIPTNYEGKDISADPGFRTLCQTKIISCAQIECWAGGATGGWYGMTSG